MGVGELALFAVTFLSENLAKGVLSAVGKDIWAFMQDVFKSDKEKKTLGELESNPSNQVTQGKVIGKLEEILEDNPEFIDRLNQLISQVKTQQKSNNQTVIGDNNTTLQDISGSRISINK